MGALFQPFDPLEKPSTSITEVQRHSVEQVLSSYNDWWDVFAEAIQNALDATYLKYYAATVTNRKNLSMKIWVEIDLTGKKHRLRVTDNGIGMDLNQFKKVFTPWITTKKETKAKLRGQKGVGATFLAYGFNHVRLSTKESRRKADSEILSCEMKQGRDWIEGIKKKPPTVHHISNFAAELNTEESGTSVDIILGGEQIRPANLEYVGLRTPEAWAKVLQIKTGLGQINLGAGDTDAKNSERLRFHPKLIVRYKDNPENDWKEFTVDKPQYQYPHEFESSEFLESGVQDVRKIEKARKDDPDSAPDHYREKHKELYNLWAIWDVWSYEELLAKEIITEDDHLLKEQTQDPGKALSQLREHNVHVYAVYVNSLRTWKAINESYKGRKGHKFVEGGYRIATSYMLQGERRVIPLVRMVGLQNNIHIIFHGQGLAPDIGRKNFTTEFNVLCDVIAQRISEKLITMRPHLRGADSGSGSSSTGGGRLDRDIIAEIVNNKGEHLGLDEVPLAIQKIPSLAIPREEQDVVVLFNQLLTAGFFRNAMVVFTSSSRQYDSGFLYEPKKEFKFDKHKRPYGVGDQALRDRDDEKKTVGDYNNKKILEYKRCGEFFLEECERGTKSLAEVDLLVCWKWSDSSEEEDLKSEITCGDYTIRSFAGQDLSKERIFYGATHRISRDTNNCEVVCLQEIVRHLKKSDDTTH